MKKHKGIIVGVIIVMVALFILSQKERRSGGEESVPISDKSTQSSSSFLTLETSITHGHGLAVDVADSNKLYIATHHGLLVLQNEKDLYRVGTSRDDYMGFSVHPAQSSVVFSSGHPERGGNIGVQRSDDGGVSWKKISNGVMGPVDFHAMAISRSEPNRMYGWYNRTVQRSDNGGESWEIVNPDISGIIQLTVDPSNKDTVYAATRDGLMISRNGGAAWENFSAQLAGGAVTAVTVQTDNPQRVVSFSERRGLAESTDGGVTWTNINFDGGTVLFLAFDPQKTQRVYALTQSNTIHRSDDGGKTWVLIR